MTDDLKYSRRSRDHTSDIALAGSRLEVRVFPGYLEEEDVKRIIFRIQQLVGDQKYPVLVIPDKDTRIGFFAVRALASEAAMNYSIATAYIIRSFHHQIMAETLFKLYTPSKPLRVFTAEAEAIHWLQSFG